MELDQLAAALTALGCPAAKAAEMAAQLDKRARQLSEEKGRTYHESLTHLLSLMRQGWAAPEHRGQTGFADSPPGLSFPMSPPASPAASVRPWPKLGSRPLGNFRVFNVRADATRSPRTGQPHEMFVLECPNWVNVVAVTPDDHLVMVQQFRHGSNTVELEIPGGVMDPGETSPVATAIRELREETGYEGENARLLGQVFANPAIMSNTCFTVLIENCRLRHERELDEGEDLVTETIPVRDVPRLVAEGRIGHSLVVVALYHYDLLRRGVKAGQGVV